LDSQPYKDPNLLQTAHLGIGNYKLIARVALTREIPPKSRSIMSNIVPGGFLPAPAVIPTSRSYQRYQILYGGRGLIEADQFTRGGEGNLPDVVLVFGVKSCQT
jgi:hypothetical protein